MELQYLLRAVVTWTLADLVLAAYNTDCKYIKISDTEYQNQRDGRYKILGEESMCSGRQAYRHDSTNNYIYFLELGDGWRGWMIGTSLCVNKGGMAVQDPALSPDQVSAKWEEVYVDNWWETNAKVTCTGALSTGSIVGIVIGVLVVVLVIGVIAFCCYKSQTKKGAVHGTGPAPGGSNPRRSQIATVSIQPATVHVRRNGPPRQQHQQQGGQHGYLGPAYQPAGMVPPPPQGWHAGPVAPPAYSSAAPANPPSAYPPYQPKPQGFAAYPASSMPPVDQGPPPSYSESQNHNVFTVASVHQQGQAGPPPGHGAQTGNNNGRRPSPSRNTDGEDEHVM